MDAIRKALAKLTVKECELVQAVLMKLASNELWGLDVKKLWVQDDIFRARKGDLRIIYRRTHGEIFILSIERRREKTYDF